MHPLIESWNELSGALPKVRKESPVLAALIDVRMATHPDIEEWREVIRRIAASAYCNGINDSGWRANFRFLLNERTFRYARAGTYDDRGKKAEGFDPGVGKPETPTPGKPETPTPGKPETPTPDWFYRCVLGPYNRECELSVAQKKWMDIYLLNEELPGECPEELEG